MKSDCLEERIARIEKYERLFDEALSCPDEDRLRQLETYYTSGEWLEDYAADERGELPSDLKRGVLSQDALYDLLADRASSQDAETGASAPAT